jgi:redox-sensing transcriptional repressor
MADSKDKPEESGGDLQVPKAVVSRLSLYLRELQHLVRDGNETTSSTQLGTRLGFTDAQVRKDLAYFGQFGYPGIGSRGKPRPGLARLSRFPAARLPHRRRV